MLRHPAVRGAGGTVFPSSHLSVGLAAWAIIFGIHLTSLAESPDFEYAFRGFPPMSSRGQAEVLRALGPTAIASASGTAHDMATPGREPLSVDRHPSLLRDACGAMENFQEVRTLHASGLASGRSAATRASDDAMLPIAIGRSIFQLCWPAPAARAHASCLTRQWRETRYRLASTNTATSRTPEATHQCSVMDWPYARAALSVSDVKSFGERFLSRYQAAKWNPVTPPQQKTQTTSTALLSSSRIFCRRP